MYLVSRMILGFKDGHPYIYALYISVREWTDAGRALHGAHYYSCGTGVRLLRRSVSMMTVSFLLQGHGHESYDVWRLLYAKSTRTHRYVPGTTGATRQTHTHVAATLHYTAIMLLDRQPCPESMGCHTTANVIPSQIFRLCIWSVITSGAQGGAGRAIGQTSLQIQGSEDSCFGIRQLRKNGVHNFLQPPDRLFLLKKCRNIRWFPHFL